MANQLVGAVMMLMALMADGVRMARETDRANLTMEKSSCGSGSFCACARASSSYERVKPLQIWSAGDVQLEVNGFVTSSSAICKPHSAYGIAYAAMTRNRDQERCSGGDMAPPSPLAAVLNDALADLMSRYFVNIAEGNAAGADLDGIWADLLADAQSGNFNSLHYAMASTAIYLTSHMGLALSALPHSDELWRNSGYGTVAQRVEVMWSEYKSTYDAFNPFLAANVDTIGDALWEARITKSKAVNIAAKLVWRGGVSAMFESIRTETFDIAMRAATEIPVGSHPLTQTYGGLKVMATNKNISGSLAAPRGTALYQLAAHARWWRRWMGDGLGPVWDSMGGLRYTELQSGTSYHTACMNAVR